jgi:predicted ATPase/transcriptional regulator with XRE-family HTH domain
MSSEFGALLRRFRQSAGLSQEALAELAGVSTSAIGAYERGVHSAPHRDTVRMLVQALGLGDDERAEFELVARRKPRSTSAGKENARSGIEALPLETSSFVGREADCEAVTELLGRHRCVTLTGIGGIGKTRLALRVAAGLQEAFPDGVAFVDLGAISDAALVGSKAAAALGAEPSGTSRELDDLAAQLRNKNVLVVLDNCEHVIQAAGDLAAAFVRSAKNVSILATSRERLRVTGETVFRLTGLAPATALSLFVERASSLESGFTVSGERVEIVADICRKLDGIPLALELAASRAGTLGLRPLQAQLTEQLAILSGGNRDVPTRQRTLDATLAWSFELLDTKERSLFRRLGVFAGGFALEAAADVCSDDGLAREDIWETASSLVDKSLVAVAVDSDSPRYRLLRLARMYAVTKAREAGEAAANARRHAGWMASSATRAHGEITMPRVAWHARYDPELDNMRAALEWGLEVDGDPLLAAAIITGFIHVWSDAGLIAEHRQWTHRILARIDETQHPREVALLLRMLMKTSVGREGIAAGERAIGLARSMDDAVGLAHALAAQASLLEKSAQNEKAVEAADEAARLYGENGLERSLPFAYVTSVRASIAARRGELESAQRLMEDALTVAVEQRDDAFVSYGRTLGAGFTFLAGDPNGALRLADEALATARELGFRHDEMLLLCNRACYELATNHPAGALADAVEALGMAHDSDPRLAALAIQHIATACALLARVPAAARLAGFVQAFHQRRGSTLHPADRRTYDLLFARLRSELSNTDFDELVEQGARLDEAAAVAEALLAWESALVSH